MADRSGQRPPPSRPPVHWCCRKSGGRRRAGLESLRRCASRRRHSVVAATSVNARRNTPRSTTWRGCEGWTRAGTGTVQSGAAKLHASASSTGTSLHATRTRTPQRSAAGPRDRRGGVPHQPVCSHKGYAGLTASAASDNPVRRSRGRSGEGRSACVARHGPPSLLLQRHAALHGGLEIAVLVKDAPRTGHPQVWDPSWRPRWLSTTTA